MTTFGKNLVDAIKRGKGSWSLAVESGRTVLAVGAVQAVKVPGGCIVAIGLNREELLKLREAADDALAIPDPPTTTEKE
jgi:hypothetical protein